MNQSIDELERDIEETRARLDLTIDRIQDKMSVSGIVDDVVGSVRRSGYSTAVDKAMLAVRDNPVPVLLMVVGLGWLIHRAGSQRRPRGVAIRPRLYEGGEAPYADRPRRRERAADHVVSAEVEVVDTKPSVAAGSSGRHETYGTAAARPAGEASPQASPFSPGRTSPMRP